MSDATTAETFDATWRKIIACEGQTFRQVRGREFQYQVVGSTVIPSTTNRQLPKSQFAEAFRRLPVSGPGAFTDLQGPSYLYAILADPRVQDRPVVPAPNDGLKGSVRRVHEDELPLIDEHSIETNADPDAVFDAVRRRFAHFLSGQLGMAMSRLLGCDPPNAFEVVEEQRPSLVVCAGQHRFSRYAIIFRITPTAAGSLLSAESRAEFPGVSGRAYRAMVVGSRGHVVATRGLLRSIAAASTVSR